jgi:hypothetical protein
MYVFYLKRTDRPKNDEVVAMTVRAETEEEARVIAESKRWNEGEGIWLNQAVCHVMGQVLDSSKTAKLIERTIFS